MKEKLILLLILTFLLLLPSNTLASTNVEEGKTIGQLEEILFDFFKENGLEYELNSIEFLEYANEQLLFEEDTKLAEHPYYEELRFYLAEYLYEIEKAQVTEVDEEGSVFDITTFNLDHISEKTINDIIIEVKEEDEAVEEEIDEFKLENPNMVSPFSTYSASQANGYAYKWYNSRNPAFPSHTLNCTNFVSQVVLAGGQRQTWGGFTSNSIRSTTNYWYSQKRTPPSGSRQIHYESTSFIRVIDFYSYWSKHMGTTTSSSKSTIINNARIGDVVQFRSTRDGRWVHSMYVHKKQNGTIYLAGNTSNVWNRNFNDISGYNSYRVIKFR
ncbi:amidase domain-containing protein [Alkalihalobacterium sp. APHAB7]|uniref:amidase domain-containing protein n=1 Tax=Alkalihalobacterium sp. APHAB7 TaxID=3402081 RepID=UPI003AAB0841